MILYFQIIYLKKRTNLLKKFKKKKFKTTLISCSVALKKPSHLKKIGLYKNFFWEENRPLRKISSNRIIKLNILEDYLYIYRMHKNNMTKSSVSEKKGVGIK